VSDEPVDPPGLVDPPSPEDLALVAAQLAGRRAGALLARIPAARGEAERVLALDVDARARALAARRAPRPAHVEQVHPDWKRALPDDDPRPAAILAGAPAGPAVRVWLERWAHGALVAMPPPLDGPLAGAADLPRARPDWLTLRLERIGLYQLAHATASAPAAAIAELAARLGLRGKAFVEAIQRIRKLGDDAPARFGPRRAAQVRCDRLDLANDRLVFMAVGARALAPHVAEVGGDLARQLAQRLPREPGLRVLAELIAWSWQRRDDAPAWAEIAQ
jgi:hypothetical protein